MKNFLRLCSTLAVLLLVGFAALGFWLAPQVEEQARIEIAALPESLAALGITLSPPPEVKEITFSPFSRRLTMRGLTVQGQLPDPTPGVLNYEMEEVSCRLPLRALLLFTPLRDLLLPDSGMMTVSDNILMINQTVSLTQGTTVMLRRQPYQEVLDLRMEGGLIREIMESGRPQNVLNAVYRMGMGRLHARDLSVSMDMPDHDIKLHITCDAVHLRNWKGRFMEEGSADNITLSNNGQKIASLGHIAQKGIALPEEALVRELLTLLAQPDPDVVALQTLVRRVYFDSEPLLRNSTLTDLNIFPDGPDQEAVSLKKATLDWESNEPLSCAFKLDELSLPVPLLERESTLSFPGLPALTFNAQVNVDGQGPDALRERGLISATHLGKLEYDFVMSSGVASPETLLGSTFKDMRVTYTDQRLMAYLLGNIFSTAQAANQALLAGIVQICPGGSPENTAIRNALETFIARPGVLEIQSKPGINFRMFEAVGQIVSQKPEALFTLSVQAGQDTLEQQMESIGAAQEQ